MDPFLASILQLETDPAGMGDPAGGEPAGAVETPPEPAAAAEPPPLWETDEFRSAVDERAAQIAAEQFEARWNQLLANAPQPQGQPVDWNERLNPLSDEFGQNFMELLAQRDQYILQQIAEQVAPLRSREEQQQISQGQEMMDEIVTNGWPEARGGPLTPDIRDEIKDRAASFLPEMTQRYGEGPMAAQAALKAASDRMVNILAQARGLGAQANVDGLAAVAAANAEPGTGGGAINTPPPATSPRDVFSRYFALNGANRQP
jgi:hypothetical protein